MEQQKLLHADLLDIIFDQRNKKYGGYELRKNYPARARRATAGVLLIAMALSAIPVIASNFGKDKTKSDIAAAMPGTTTIDNIANVKKPKPVVTQTPPAPARLAPTVRNPTYVIKPATDVIEDAPRPVDSLGNRQIGAHDNPGEAGGLVADNGQLSGNGTGMNNGSGNSGGHEIDTDPPGPKRLVDQMPQFNGDVNAFLAKNLQYPEDAREKGKEGRVVVQFVVNEDGAITSTEVVKSIDKSLDAEAMRVVNAMPRWKPGKQNGVPMKVYYMLPIIFTLD